MKKEKTIWSTVLLVIWLLWGCGTYYLLLPALNIHSLGLWCYVIFLVLLPLVLNLVLISWINGNTGSVPRPTAILFCVAMLLLVVFLILIFVNGKFFHAKAYAGILQVEECEFTEDLNADQAISNIALMDTASAILLGNREIGSLSQVVSQYNVSEEYTQIDQNQRPKKVSALEYAGFFKYMGNKESGVPGYVEVDPVHQKAEYVALEKNMHYVPSAYFSKDLRRKLRFTYPTKIFGNMHFEVDEEGRPYYIASVYGYEIGIFGGETVVGAIVLDPVTGDSQYYALEDVPQWVDDVYDAETITTQYNWYGELSNGFWNSQFGKKGCKKCTETIDASSDDSEDEEDEEEFYVPNYGYIAKDGDIWIYTGVTSVNDDASNIGFLMANERTGEAHYFSVAGADENSAMAAAEGEVQEKRYQASFPSLVNVDGEPTYIMVLKDSTGIVKLYAMVNVRSYNLVVTSDDIEECFKKYHKKIGNGAEEEEETTEEQDAKKDKDAKEDIDLAQAFETKITLDRIEYVTIEGDTYVYLIATDGKAYKQRFKDDEKILFCQKKDTLKVKCVETQDGICQIVSFERLAEKK